jgi:hypothetical protein
LVEQLICNQQVAGSNPVTSSMHEKYNSNAKIGLFFLFFSITLYWRGSGCKMRIAHVAQSVEHFLGKGEVIGSSPIAGSRNRFVTLGIV